VRALIYVPMLHSQADLGRMADDVRRQYAAAFGPGAWDRRASAIGALWDDIRAKVLALPLRWDTVRLYQDGLPVCDHEADIVRDVAAAGSQDHQLLLELMGRGATLMGTEDASLLLREYERVQRLVLAGRSGAPSRSVGDTAEGRTLLEERDAFMARRIDETLEQGETGILFLGLLHRVDRLTAGRFEVQHVIHNLPLGADPWGHREAGDHGKK
jgi:hypothetical protein